MGKTFAYPIDTKQKPISTMHKVGMPFDSVEDAWFWFIAAQQAKNEGARFVAGQGNIIRPCEPVDILNILDRLYRQRRLVRDHLLVLRHYGRRNQAPDSRRVKEKRAAILWSQAIERLEPVFIRKGITAVQSGPFGLHEQDHLFEDGVLA